MAPNTKAAIFLGALRRTGPEWIAAIALGWILRDVPAMAWWHGRRIGQVVPALWTEGKYRIPPSKIKDLKDTYPTIQWINAHIPADRPLLYVGGMNRGVRLRYYTLPRAGNWLYLYHKHDIARVPEVLAATAPTHVVLERKSTEGKLELPANWRNAWIDPARQFAIYEVGDHAGE